jgi:hypothetical protein
MFTRLEKFLFLVTGCAVAAIFTDHALKTYKFPEKPEPQTVISVFTVSNADNTDCANYINTIIQKYTLGPSIVTYTSKRFGIPENQVGISHVRKVIDLMEQDCQTLVKGN